MTTVMTMMMCDDGSTREEGQAGTGAQGVTEEEE